VEEATHEGEVSCLNPTGREARDFMRKDTTGGWLREPPVEIYFLLAVN